MYVMIVPATAKEYLRQGHSQDHKTNVKSSTEQKNISRDYDRDSRLPGNNAATHQVVAYTTCLNGVT